MRRRTGLIAAGALVTACLLYQSGERIQKRRPITITATEPGNYTSAAERSLRPNYPYSVIPGGVYSRGELKASINKDEVVRAHYADFDVNSARLVTLTEERLQYVSYRLHDKIFWTRQRIRIPKGETLITDGRNFARTRCGNRLCAALPTGVRFTLVPLKKLEFPTFTIGQVQQFSFASPPEINMPFFSHMNLAFALPPAAPYQTAVTGKTIQTPSAGATPMIGVSPGFLIIPISGGSPIGGPLSVVPIAGVPEPSNFYMLLAGISLIGLLYLLFKK